MYTAEQTKVLQDQSKDILSQLDNSMAFNDLALLKQVLRFHEYRYYVLNDPLLSDYEYDLLYQCLVKQEAANPDKISPDSPTQRVGSSLNQFFETTPHLVPMLSLDNSYNAEDLQDFD
ncbi:MAG: DNA ligase (NAD(+)) LigA, partial [Chitinophagaceae bacterium]|nr:DNA ligase (NAD(+)) LigA [Chitinophagaceae bacterium]